MSTCIECGGETRLTLNPDSRFRSILIVDAATGTRHVCDVGGKVTGRLACVCGSTDIEWRQGTQGNPYWACNVCEPIG